jgi:hypothetical protein
MYILFKLVNAYKKLKMPNFKKKKVKRSLTKL